MSDNNTQMNQNRNNTIDIQDFLKNNDVGSKTFMVRADFNVPIADGIVVEDLRMRSIIPTVNLLKDASAKIILISHLETKDGSGMEVVAKHFNEKLGVSVKFIDEVVGDNVKKAAAGLLDGEILLLQNLRVNPGEKTNNEDFAKELASYADFYVNDAFSVSHREHASVVGIPKFLPHFAGVQLMKEIKSLQEAINPPHPFVFILGGAKFETKLPLIRKYLDKAEYVILGGALVNDVYKARGFNIGKSLVSDGSIDISGIVSNPKLILSEDVVVHDVNNVKKVSIKRMEEVGDADVIADTGPQILEILRPMFSSAKFVLWNGPLGNYETGFSDQTIGCAKLLIESGVRGAIGGGDTVAAVKALGLDGGDSFEKIFVSTGGGAMIDFLVNETLPGIEALK